MKTAPPPEHSLLIELSLAPSGYHLSYSTHSTSMSKHGATIPTMQYDCNMSCCPENEVKEVQLTAFSLLAFGSSRVCIAGKTGKLNDVAQLKKKGGK